jgi:hypothetical protein
MSLNLVPFVMLWCVLVAVVVAIAVWRKTVEHHDDHFVHVMGTAPAITQQAALAHKLDSIDRWGKALTAVAVVFGVILCAIYVWQTWAGRADILSGS